MKRIAVLTSGGDAPGMNAAVRAVTRGTLAKGWEVLGVRNGYAGLVAGTMEPLAARDVGGIMQDGGTALGSARSPEFTEAAGREKALRNLATRGVEALVVIGGNGSQTGSAALSREGFSVVGIPSTIDNDLYGTDVSIGADTAINVTLEAIDRLRTTASSHQRAFLVETMGRDCGYIALMEHYKEHRDSIGFELRLTRLGHVVRGGAPSAADRVLATRLGAAAADALAAGRHGVLVGLVRNEIEQTALGEIAGRMRPADAGLLEMARTMAL